MTRITARVDTVVIGAGQAGLAAGYHLRRAGRRFVILEAATRPGESWRRRWDALRLFTPAGYSHLPGLRLPLRRTEFPTKDQLAGHLVEFAQRHRLPVETGVRVDRLAGTGEDLLVAAGERRWSAADVILASGAHVVARVPEFAAELAPAVTQLTALDYRNPQGLPAGPVLVVGAGNSGAEIALDLATRSARTVYLAGRDVGHLPRWGASTLLFPLMRLAGTWGARQARQRLGSAGDPLGRVRPHEFVEAGIVRTPRVVGTRDGRPVLADDRTLDVAAVVWCTGSGPDHSWLPPELLDDSGMVRQQHGVTEQPGLYVLGLPFQCAIGSHLVGGVARDAARIVEHIERRPVSRRPSAPAPR